jgi:hypothetical protein
VEGSPRIYDRPGGTQRTDSQVGNVGALILVDEVVESSAAYHRPPTSRGRTHKEGLLPKNLSPEARRASIVEALMFVAQRGAGRNRTDEWRFCSSQRAFAMLSTLSETTTRAAVGLSCHRFRSTIFCVLFG